LDSILPPPNNEALYTKIVLRDEAKALPRRLPLEPQFEATTAAP
jgi:hypothetical protein